MVTNPCSCHSYLDANAIDWEEPMQRTLMIAAGAMLAALATATTVQAQSRVEVGVLTCTARGSTGFIIGSSRELRCRFNRPGRDEYYRGTIDKFGIDIGSTKQAVISWAVLAPTSNLPLALAQRQLRRRERRSHCRRGRGRQCPDRGLTTLDRAAAAERAGAARPEHRRRRIAAAAPGRLAATKYAARESSA